METMGEAKEYCWSIGGYLAEIITEEEESLLDNYLISGISYWIGLSDMDHEGLVSEDPRSITYPFQDCTDGKIVTERQFTQTGLLMNHQILLQKTV